MIEPQHAVAARRQFRIMGHDHDRRAAAAREREENVEHAARRIAIEVAGRLIGENTIGPSDDRARNCGALALTAR